MNKSFYQHCCGSMERYLSSEDQVIVYNARYREYGIAVCDGGSSHIRVEYCPWCGQKLPINLRGEWFNRMDDMDIDPASKMVPKEYLTDLWWQKEGL